VITQGCFVLRTVIISHIPLSLQSCSRILNFIVFLQSILDFHSYFITFLQLAAVSIGPIAGVVGVILWCSADNSQNEHWHWHHGDQCDTKSNSHCSRTIDIFSPC